ncbi:MAG: ABC transporter substrate-binding protein [Clostridia bacterium]|nr:ABC transporter substrate-binding protein [Clostridia bacterium]
MKKILSLLLTLVLVLGLAACGSADTLSSIPTETVPEKLDTECNVYALKGPTGIGMVPLMDAADNENANLKYNFNLVGANDEIVAKIANGEADIAAVATNLASTLYKKTNGKISVLAVNTLGMLSVVSKGEEITSIKDLKGKTVYSTGQGANPEYIINKILSANGLKIGEDVKIEFVAQPQELVTKVVPNEKAIVIAPQPVATAITVKDKAAKIVIDLNDEWDKISDTPLVMGCVIARNEYIKQNPDAVKIFLKDYEKAINSVNSDTKKASELSAKYEIITPAPVAQKAIGYCNIVYQDGKELKTNLSAYLKFLFDSNPTSIGGELPADNFYYE